MSAKLPFNCNLKFSDLQGTQNVFETRLRGRVHRPCQHGVHRHLVHHQRPDGRRRILARNKLHWLQKVRLG